MDELAAYFVPFVLTASGLMLAFSRQNLMPEFISGIKNGMKTAYEILPTLIVLIVGVRMFSASGALDALCGLLSPFTEMLGMKPDILPLLLMRPLSGSGSTAVAKELFSLCGPDSFTGLFASILMGSSDTVFYTLSVYLSHTKSRKGAYCLPLSLLILGVCTAVSYLIARLMLS